MSNTERVREQIEEAVGEYSATVMRDNPSWVFNPLTAITLVDQILAISGLHVEAADQSKPEKLISCGFGCEVLLRDWVKVEPK